MSSHPFCAHFSRVATKSRIERRKADDGLIIKSKVELLLTSPPERKDIIEIRAPSSKLLDCLPFTSFERWEHLKCLPVQDLSVVDVDQVNSYHQEYYNRKVHDGTLDNLLELFRRTHKYCLQMLLSPKYQLALFNLTKKMMTERKSMDHTTSALYRWNLTDIFS